MDKGDEVQSKYKFKLKNAIVDQIFANGTVQVKHDMCRRKWIGHRPQLGDTSKKKQRVICRCLDLFDIEDLVVING